MALGTKSNPVEFFWKYQGLGRPWNRPGSPPSQAVIQSVLKTSSNDVTELWWPWGQCKLVYRTLPTSIHHLMQWVGGVMTKMGDNHPPLGAMMVRSGGVAPTSLSPPLSTQNGVCTVCETRGPSDEMLWRSNGEDQGSVDMVTHWIRRGGGIPDEILLGHVAGPKWLWRDVVGPSGTPMLWRDAQQAGGVAPQHWSGTLVKKGSMAKDLSPANLVAG